MKIRLLSTVQGDRKIACIKALRDASRAADDTLFAPMGLREAKDAIDKVMGTYDAVLGRYVGGNAPVIVDVQRPEKLDGYLIWETVSDAFDAARFALRASVVGVSPATLEALAVGAPFGSETQRGLNEAATLLRSVGATS